MTLKNKSNNRLSPASQKCGRLITLLFLLGTVHFIVHGQANEHGKGETAEQAGKLREAVTHYVAALQSTADGSDENQRLREKIIKLVLKLDPPPAVPDEALRYIGRGKAAIEVANGAEDFRRAAVEFHKAVRSAPWLASGYFNLGVVEEKAEQYTDAIRNFRFYLLAAPSASDTQDVQSKIYGLEYKLERRREEERAAQERLAKERQEQEARARDFSRLAGEWCFEDERGGFRNCGFKMRVAANRFEVLVWRNERWYTHIRGYFEGNKMTGEVFQHETCPDAGAPITGILSNDERRIELRGVRATSLWRCTVTETEPYSRTLVRRQ